MKPLALAVPALVLLAGCIGLNGATGVPPPVTVETITLATDHGAVVVALYPEAAPETVALMTAFTSEGYWDNREFNRVVPGHVVQIIDKVGGATEDPRRVPLEVTEDHYFSAGAVGVARGAEPDSGGPEIFIMDFATSHLHRNYTVWGQVIEGMDAVHAMARVEAVEIPNAPVIDQFFTDRQPVQAPLVNAATLGTMDLDVRSFFALPRFVPENVRVDDVRVSLEVPGNLLAQRSEPVSLFLRPYGEAELPDTSALTVRGGGPTTPLVPRAGVPGAFDFTWTPPYAGAVRLNVLLDGEPYASFVVQVAA